MTSLDGLKLFLKKYDKVVETRKANADICASEFQAIKLQSVEDKKELLSLEGAKDANKKKNRYKDILPFDHSRVVLHKDKFIDGSDYINANHIEDEFGKKAYIAAQGPMPNTVDDFWRMIWQFKIKMVVMGCKEIEMGKNRCHRYWAELGEEMWFHDIKVTLVDSKSYAHNMKLRQLKAEKNGMSHILTQLHYMDWPDHGAPETTETILQLIEVLREKHPMDDPPILIHCSAGCGRTGAIIATDCGRKLILSHEKNIDVLTIVSRLRRQRPALVQSKEQYEFIYEVFREMVTREIQQYESQFQSNYMNINSFPIKKADPPVFSSHHPVQQSKENITIANLQVISDEKRQIILPQEHAVNTDSGVIRRSRSAYGKKSKQNNPKSKSTAPPEVPIKESKLTILSKEKLYEGPVLPPKSPKSLNRHKSLDLSMQQSSLSMEGSGSVTGNVPPIKPKLLKKPIVESFVTPQNKLEGDYLHLELSSSVDITPQEDFIPEPTPVGFSQYPMRSKMSHSTSSHPKLPMKKPGSTTKKKICKNTAWEPQIINQEKKSKDPNKLFGLGNPSNSSNPPKQTSVVSNPSNQKSGFVTSGPPNKTCYSTNQINQNVVESSSKDIFGSASSSFDTSLVKNVDILDTSNQMISDLYAVVDMSKKTKVTKDTTKKEFGNDKSKYVPKEYESLSGDIVGHPPANKFAPSYINVECPVNTQDMNAGIKEELNIRLVHSTLDTLPNNKIELHMDKCTESPAFIKPYKVTDVGFGYKKKTNVGNEPERANQEVPNKFVPNKEMQHIPVTPEGPPLPIRRGASYPPGVKKCVPDDDLYSDISVHIQPVVDLQQEKLTPPPVGINWFNSKVKNLGKRTSVPTIPSDLMWKQSFDINDKFGYPHRLHVKPSGPRPQPSSWKQMPFP